MATPHLSFGQFVSQQTDHSIEQINIFSDSHNVGAWNHDREQESMIAPAWNRPGKVFRGRAC